MEYVASEGQVKTLQWLRQQALNLLSSWRSKTCNSHFALWSHLMYPSNFHTQKCNFRQPCQNNSAPSQVLLFASPAPFRRGCGEETLWQHQSDCAHFQRIHSIRWVTEKLRKTLHYTDDSRHRIFKQAELLYFRRATLISTNIDIRSTNLDPPLQPVKSFTVSQ